MNQLLRNAISSSARNSLIRIVSVAALGSGLLCANSDSCSGTRITVSINAPFRESLSLLPWQLSENLSPRLSFLSAEQWKFGDLPLFTSRVSPAPSEHIRKEAPGGEGDGAEQYIGYIGRDTTADAATRVGPAVVIISVPLDFLGIPYGYRICSGTIIDASGTILTCAHVVDDFQGMRKISKGKIQVTLQDGRTFYGTVVNADHHSDIAIVKINSRTPFLTAKLGSSSNLRPGDLVLAMGCSCSLQNTVTAGIVSCVDRKSSDLGIRGHQREYLQTDCAPDLGDAGGPLVNIDGEVVGVNIMKLSNADGLNFSVPIDEVSKIIEHFNKSGRVIWPCLGLKMVELNEMIIAQLKERDAKFPNVSRGVLVQMVVPGSPADRAGFHHGDVVIEFDGMPVKSSKEIIEVMEDRIGVPLKVVVKRANDNVETLTVVPEESNVKSSLCDKLPLLCFFRRRSQVSDFI
ncbi:putative protease Do-like 14 isoform X1 [Tripterygium wilfordii]|uniref:putative protease Do-like 14 isoform X1 n=1 Tax=Tripterygium wilfordii TaxID=458696 RepID=UPI0018F801E8|nr:putative protease Do-like 14 isoform X1 [Tripterygium wilfordii]